MESEVYEYIAKIESLLREALTKLSQLEMKFINSSDIRNSDP